ncbi:MAG TPA: hypothetical protein VND91_09000 [Candidatus Saccharimonadia bacterium]|nr:hypothetical protein [Candidatus Saccharimonadia bacterium]
MPNVPPSRDPNRPKPRRARGAAAQPDPAPQRRTQSNDDARQDGALSRHGESDGGIGVRARGGYAEQAPAASAGKPTTGAGKGVGGKDKAGRVKSRPS